MRGDNALVDIKVEVFRERLLWFGIGLEQALYRGLPCGALDFSELFIRSAGVDAVIADHLCVFL